MLERMKKHLIKPQEAVDGYTYCLTATGQLLRIKSNELTQHKVTNHLIRQALCQQILKNFQEKSGDEAWSDIDIFTPVNEKYGKQGALLKGIRLREDLNQQEFAERIGITQPELSKLETSKRAISKRMAQHIGQLFNIDYRVLL